MIFITGSTGFLGRQLLGRLLLRKHDQDISILLRPSSSSNQSPEARIRELLVDTFGNSFDESYLDRVKPILGDLTEDRLGISNYDFQHLSKEVKSIYHCAATTNLGEGLAEARAINLGGTEKVIELAKSCRTYRDDVSIFHTSTAYVAGSTDRNVSASELSLTGSFRNGYEQSKAESEALIRGISEDIHVRIFRPSVIVGDSVTGQTSAFNVIYVPARLMLGGLFKKMPALPHVPFDLVPVDYVADAMVELSEIEAKSGSCYHLTAGIGRESSPLEIIESVFKAFHKHRQKHLNAPGFISPETLMKAISSFSAAAEGLLTLEKKVSSHFNVFRRIMPFIPYMLSNPRFDTAETIRDLNGRVEEPPLFSSYAERIFGYCLQTDWGKRPWSNPHNFVPWPNRLHRQTR